MAPTDLATLLLAGSSGGISTDGARRNTHAAGLLLQGPRLGPIEAASSPSQGPCTGSAGLDSPGG